ncbi:MAG: glycosyltransferase, partial [Thermoguttaceae bacterium]
VDVVLLSSHIEAAPASILESMACEKPVVATRVGSVPEIVVEGKTGYLVTPDDEQQLAQRTLELLCHPDLAAVLGRAGRELVLANWSVDRMVRAYEDLITGLYEMKAGNGRQRPECKGAEEQKRLVVHEL